MLGEHRASLEAPDPLTLSFVSRKPQEERGERRETAKARRKQLEDLLCTGPGPQHSPKEAFTVAGGHPCTPAAFRSEAAVGGELGWRGGTPECSMPILPLFAGGRPDTVTLRSAKSEESLSSQASGAGERQVAQARPCGGAGRAGGPGVASKCTSNLWVWGSFLMFFSS